MTESVRLPQLVWHGVKDLELSFPENWKVQVFNMQGFDSPGIAGGQLRAALRFPLGMPPLRNLAKNRKQAVIIFDDIQRATRTADIIPFILEELAEAGLKDDQIRFVAATGLHAPMTRLDFSKKLGEDVLARFPVYNHNAFGNCIDIGKTRLGTPLLVNAEVMQCDLKIAIGSIVPHAFAGFGGGAKIILPGICHFDTVVHFHKLASQFKKEHPEIPVGTGIISNNLLRENMEEAAQKAGLDIKIDTLMNSYGETAAIFAGALNETSRLALQLAVNHYDTPEAKDNDIVIANTFAKVAECESGLEIAFQALGAKGGDVVLVANSPDGHVAHYLGGVWGTANSSPLPLKVKFPAELNRLIILNEYPDRTILGYFSEPQKVDLVSNWNAVLDLLKLSHPGAASVAVYPNAEIQYCSSQSGSSALSF
ncbi:MAG TPA: lactate racemase domain-containing protein [Dehalococcoidales bacterium]|nr:lactate racemase domain-containing protein [Dehalococcoidales bacterium]